MIAVLNISRQTLADATALGAIYALMAVGIGLVFGVLRLVNFAYGQLVMAGAFALALASQWGWPGWAGILLCFAVVLALSVAMDYLVFRPLRGHPPAVMLVATFAVAFLLQSIALLWFGPLGKIASSLAYLNRPVTLTGVDIRKITIVALVVAAACLAALWLLLERTTIGLQMRASSMDFQTARLLGVRANRVIGAAVLLSGALAAVVAVMLSVQTPLVTPDFALRDTIIVLAGVVLGGMNRPIPATLGGFSIGFASGLLGGALPTAKSQYLPTFLFVAVIVILLVRPRRPVRPDASGGASMRSFSSLEQLVAPAALVIAAALLGAAVSASTQTYFIDSLVKVSIVVALYVFVGNSGVLSFGHISFVAVGAWTAGVLTVPVGEKPAIMPNLAHWLVHRTAGNVTSLALAALLGGVAALVVGIPLMRLSGLAAGIATFAVLEITHNMLRYYEKIGPGLNTFSSVPETTGLRQAAIGALVVIVVAFAYARSRFGRLLRATREDAAAARAVGTSVYRQRLVAFAISGLLAGLAGGLYVHLLPLNTEGLYLDLTFITLAMLVVGGSGSLLGAVVGALAVSALDSYLAVAENGTSLFGWNIDLPAGTRVIVVGVLMAVVLIVRPSGLTGGREFRLPRRAT